MATVTASQGQTLADICVQEFGSLEALMAFALANDMAVTDVPSTDQSLTAVDVKDAQVANIFTVSGQKPATAL